MVFFDLRFGEIIKDAHTRAKEVRNSDGITIIDFIVAEIQDSKSMLRAQALEKMSSRQIDDICYEAIEKLSEEEPIEYGFLLRFDDEQIPSSNDVRIYIQMVLAVLEGKYIFNTEQLVYMAIAQPINQVIELLLSLNINIGLAKQVYYEGFASMQPIPENNCLEKNASAEKSSSEIVDEIPKEMAGFISEVEPDADVATRDKETKAAWKILMKKTKRNFVLVGDQGVGKTAIVHKMAAEIKNGTAPAEFKDFKIYAVDVNAVVAGTNLRGMAEERFMLIIDFIQKNKNAILFIDEAHLILGAGSAGRSGELDFANALKPILASGDSRVIAATTTEEYEKYFSRDKAVKRRFEKITVKEPKSTEVPEMIKNKVETLSQYHGVKISEDDIEKIIMYASCFNSTTRNPDRTLDLIDCSMVLAKLDGKDELSEKHILDNFEIDIKAFNNMSYEEKLATAYHETGHFLAFYFLPYMKKVRQVTAVSIYPTEHYMGVTVTDKKDTLAVKGKNQFLDEIATRLAGGIAENLISNEFNAGISGDAAQATKIARYMIAQAGFTKNFFVNDKEARTQKLVNEENKEIKVILAEANKRAKDLIELHKNELKIIAETLVEKGIMTLQEIEKLIEETTENKQ